jgi:hypothetical protein
MIKPFRIVWELIEFGLQALFVYVFAIIILIGLFIIVIKDDSTHKKDKERMIHPIEQKECTRPSGCRILEDGTVEW